MAHIAISQIFAESMIRRKSITGQNDNNNNILVCEVIIYLRNIKNRAKQVSGREIRIKNIRRVKK